MIKLKRAKLAVNNGSVVVYYSREGVLRYPTGVVISKRMSRKKYIDWDYSDNFIKPNVEGYDVKKATLEAILKKANDIITEHYQNGDELSAAELKKLLDDADYHVATTRTSDILDLYIDFYERKKKLYASRDTIISLKDYTSFKNMLIDYQAIHGVKLRLRDIDRNERFLEGLLTWLRGEMPKSVGDHKVRTGGLMGEKTLRKRFDVLLQFWESLKKDGKVTDTDFIRNFAKSQIRPKSKAKVTLTVEEIHAIYDFPFEDESHRRVIDLFVFACFTGLRWADLMDFDPRFVEPAQDGGGSVYRRTAKKTRDSSGMDFEIPLCDTALEILKRYEGSLQPLKMSNVEANRRIKEALETTGLFGRVTALRDKRTDEYKRRWEAVTMHKARDTFISNLVQVTPLNELMRYTAHSKLSTLQRYLDTSRSISTAYVAQTFNRSKNDEKRKQRPRK